MAQALYGGRRGIVFVTRGEQVDEIERCVAAFEAVEEIDRHAGERLRDLAEFGEEGSCALR